MKNLEGVAKKNMLGESHKKYGVKGPQKKKRYVRQKVKICLGLGVDGIFNSFLLRISNGAALIRDIGSHRKVLGI